MKKYAKWLAISVFGLFMQGGAGAFAADFVIKATATGINNTVLNINVQPDLSVTGLPGSFFIAAKLPNGTWFYPTQSGWRPWDQTVPLPAYMTTTLQATNNFTVTQDAYVSSYAGAAIYAGYGTSMDAMIVNGTYSSIYQVSGPLKTPPNILFVIMDDVGIDQMKIFGYGGQTPPSTPNIDLIANTGIRFRNNWAMPACSPSRAIFFQGRFPMRSNVLGALGPSDLANSMVTPYDITAPKLLKQRNYQSGLFGKFHLGLQGNSPYKYAMPHSLGWDYYFGWLDETGDPSSIDTSAGGVAPTGTTYSCGFVPGAADGGVDQGACYSSDGTCRMMSGSALNPPGRMCLESGGILDPNQSCQLKKPSYVDFSRMNAHYVSPLDIVHEDGSVERIPPTDIRARTFRGTAPVDAAIDWINSRPQGQPWMATLSFATVHTPLQQPPAALLPAGSVNANGVDCANINQWFILNNQMITAMDTEIGRLLVATGLARRGQDGGLIYTPQSTGTMIVLVGDNGSLGYTTKLPFDPTRAKGTAYQTGVWVPLIVAGPLVSQPNRDVPYMTNIADIYQLFGEIAGIDVHANVQWPIDSTAMMPYLVNPNQKSVRTWNYNQIDLNLQANGAINGPCVMNSGSSCSHIPVTKTVCEDNSGVWWGAGATDPSTSGIPPEGLKYCCEVDIWLADHGQLTIPIVPQGSAAVRNESYKVVSNTTKDYDAASNACVDRRDYEFYEINENVPVPKLDKEGTNLLDGRTLTPEQQRNYTALMTKLSAIQNSVVQCEGDGNLDMVVDYKDLDEWQTFNKLYGGDSSWYDFNLDGLTNDADKAIILQNLGRNCQAANSQANAGLTR